MSQRIRSGVRNIVELSDRTIGSLAGHGHHRPLSLDGLAKETKSEFIATERVGAGVCLVNHEHPYGQTNAEAVVDTPGSIEQMGDSPSGS